MLTYYFANKYSNIFNKKFLGVGTSLWKSMLAYDWPGNIRELENTVEYMINMMDASGIISANNLPPKMIGYSSAASQINIPSEPIDDVVSLEVLERDMIQRSLLKYGSSTEGKKIAAEKLGIGIATLYRKVAKYNL